MAKLFVLCCLIALCVPTVLAGSKPDAQKEPKEQDVEDLKTSGSDGGYDEPVLIDNKPVACDEYDKMHCPFSEGKDSNCSDIYVCNWKSKHLEKEVIGTAVAAALKLSYRTRIGRWGAGKFNQMITNSQKPKSWKDCGEAKMHSLVVENNVIFDEGHKCKRGAKCENVIMKACDIVKDFIIEFHITSERVFDELDGVTKTEEEKKGKTVPVYDLSNFKSKNDFFIRKLKTGDENPRPIADLEDDAVIVSPADSRTHVFENIQAAQRFWVRGKVLDGKAEAPEKVTLGKILEPAVKDFGVNVDDYVGGALVISRLAPQDYHRFHWPVSGKLVSVSVIHGEELYSVNPLAITSPINVFGENKRLACLIETDFGNVIFIPVGATVVGSIVITSKVGETHKKGDEMGLFQFGGSTTLTFFSNTIKVTFDEELLNLSKGGQGHRHALEASLLMGTKLGEMSRAAADDSDDSIPHGKPTANLRAKKQANFKKAKKSSSQNKKQHHN